MKYFIISYIQKISNKILGLICFLWSIIAVCYQYLLNEIGIIKSAEYCYDSAIIIVWVILLFAVVCTLEVHEKNYSVITKLSELSFGIYIVHPLIIGVLRMIFGFSSSKGQIILFIITLGVSIICVWIMNLIKPFDKLVNM